MNKNDDTSKKIRKRIQVMNSSDSEVENEVEEDSKKRESIDLFQTQNGKYEKYNHFFYLLVLFIVAV